MIYLMSWVALTKPMGFLKKLSVGLLNILFNGEPRCDGTVTARMALMSWVALTQPMGFLKTVSWIVENFIHCEDGTDELGCLDSTHGFP